MQAQDHAPLLDQIFSVDLHEESYVIESISGTIPEYVRGAYYLNGPARFSIGDVTYNNWLDGDGMVTSLAFTDEAVKFTNRFVHSHKYLAEEKAGRAIYRCFGTAFEGDELKRGIGTESPINVSLYPFANRLLAFGEQSMPYELEMETLETIGPFDFDGYLNDITPFSAHPKFDRESGEMFNFGISFSSRQPRLTLHRFDATGKIIFRKRLAIDYACSIHDFGLSPSYAIFYLSPYILDIEKLTQNGSATIDTMSWRPELGSQLRILSREDGTEVANIPIGQGYCLHLANCFEADGLLVVDVVEYERPLYEEYQPIPDLFTTVSPGRPVRLSIDMSSQEIVGRHVVDYARSPDFPGCDPRLLTKPCQDMWMLGISKATGQNGRKFYDELVHVEWQQDTVRDLYRAPAGSYLGGEPVFLGDPSDESKGAIICQIHDTSNQQSDFAIFDAFDVSAGPQARLHLRHPIRLGFHACFDG
ncbi:MAG: carotenoid oxygenase family protein [Candidatus Latescibacteria bacterium]|nr:carotenoid oxygenase family protein [Candidatus Latescibacterota bacterium]